MATSMMQPDAENTAEAAAPGEEADGGTELCIKVAADGGISFYTEAGEDETAEQTAKPCQDIGEALKMALDAYKSLGAQTGTDEFNAGFGKQPEARPADARMKGVFRA